MTWTQILKMCTTTSNINNNEDNIPIKIDNKHTTIDKVKYRDYHWHLIKYKHYTPKTSKKNGQLHTLILTMQNKKYGQELFYYPFKCCSETKIQSFQYKPIHRIIPCNSWLNNITIK